MIEHQTLNYLISIFKQITIIILINTKTSVLTLTRELNGCGFE